VSDQSDPISSLPIEGVSAPDREAIHHLLLHGHVVLRTSFLYERSGSSPLVFPDEATLVLHLQVLQATGQQKVREIMLHDLLRQARLHDDR